MPYTKTDWKDRVVEKPLTYNLITNADGTTTLDPEEGAIIETGTPINAVTMNNLESQYDKAVADSLPRAGGSLTGPITSNSDITTSADINALDGNFTGNVTSANINCDVITAERVDLTSASGELKNVVLVRDEGDAGANNGFGVAIGAGGTTIIGGGESPQNILVSTLVPNTGTERIIISSDNEIEFMMGMQNVGTDVTVGKRARFASNGDLNWGGNNVDANAGVLSYNTATKGASIRHWNGTVSSDDVTLTVNKVVQTGASQGQVLWTSTGQYMTAGQTVTPSVSLDNCACGWQLIWSDYDAGVGSNNIQFTSTFIHKGQIAGNSLHMIPQFYGDDTVAGRFVVKELTNTRTVITGSANNDGLNDVCLRQVLSY